MAGPDELPSCSGVTRLTVADDVSIVGFSCECQRPPASLLTDRRENPCCLLRNFPEFAARSRIDTTATLYVGFSGKNWTRIPEKNRKNSRSRPRRFGAVKR